MDDFDDEERRNRVAQAIGGRTSGEPTPYGSISERDPSDSVLSDPDVSDELTLPQGSSTDDRDMAYKKQVGEATQGLDQDRDFIAKQQNQNNMGRAFNNLAHVASTEKADHSLYDSMDKQLAGLGEAGQKKADLSARVRDAIERRYSNRDLASQKLALQKQALDLKKRALGEKSNELSVAQAKQAGLYNSGVQAENQFRKSLKGGYDPTDATKIVDNYDYAPNVMRSNDSIKARSAQDAWIESFLRDASGAAIPQNERGDYRKQFFPQPGDPPDVLANKQQLREQKMANAKLAAGNKAHLASLEDSLDKEPAQKMAMSQIPSDRVLVRRKNGKTGHVPRASLKRELANGSEVLDEGVAAR